MKRNELLAKSLTLGLAVATAATSMSVPGGLLAPQTVYAEDGGGTTTGDSTSKVKLSSENVGEYFTLSDQPIVAVTLKEQVVTEVKGPDVKCVKEGTSVIDGGLYGKLTITFKDSEKNDVQKKDLKVGKTYNAYINVDGNGSVLAAADEPVNLGEVTVYEDLGDNATLTYKDGADDTAGVTDLTSKEFKNDVVISVFEGATISTSSTVGTDTSVTISRGNIVSGSLPVVLYVKKGDTTYAKIVTLNFAQKAAPSEMTGTASITTAQGEAISKLVIGDTVKAKYEGSDAKSLKYQWYRVPLEGDEAVKIADATTETYTLTAADKGYKMKVVISDATLSGSKEATTEAVVKMKGVNLADVNVTLNDSAGKNEFTYTGESVIKSVKVASGETELDKSKYKVYYTDSAATEAGTDTVAPTAVGDYKLWIVPAEGADEDCYDSQSVAFSIEAITVDKNTIDNYIAYTGLSNLKLTYNGEDQWDNIFAVISSKNTKLVPEDELDVVFKKQDDASQKDYLDDIVDAGTYNVYVGIDLKNIKTTEPVKIGTVTVDKYKTDASAIKVVGNESTYYGGTVLHKNMDVTDPLMKDHVTLTYKQVKDGNGNAVDKDASEAAPVDAGIYEIYAAYNHDPNCEALGTTKTDAQIVITKADKKVTAGQLVVNKDATEERSIDLTAIVNELKCEGLDQPITADVTSKDDYFTKDGLKYEGGVIKVTLDTTKTGSLTDNTKATIHVDFKNSFNNYKVAFDIPVVITTKKVANITIANAAAGVLGTYESLPKQLTFTISGVDGLDLTGKTDAEIANACSGKYGDSNWAFGCTIHNQNGEEIKSIENAGTYSVHVTYWDSTCYGEITDVIVVEPKEIEQTADFNGILSLGTASFAYNFENQYDAIKKLVQLDAKDGVGSGDYDVVIKKGDSETEDASDAGSYGVYIAFNHGNYTTSGKLVQLGTVDIAENKDAITLDVAKDGTPIVKVGSRTIPNETLQTIQYFDEKGNELKVKPTAAGKYKVKVSYTNSNLENKLEGAVKEFTITSGSSSGSSSSGSSTSGGSSAGGGAATTPSKDDTKKDDTKKDTTTKTETKPDGTKVTTTETKAADGSVQTRIELKNDTAGVDATVNVAKDAQGKVTGVTADVNQTATDKQTAISAATVAQITAAAGTKDVAITTKTVDANGKTVREVTVNASDLTAGKKLKVVAVDPKTGEKTLVNKTTYKVAADGSLALDNLGNDSYEVVTTAEVNALTKEILQSIRPERSKANIAAGKKTKLSLDDALNMDNVAKITYKTSKKSVATVNPNGTVTARKEGKVTIKAIVTLNNGKKKTVRMNLTVKARK